MQRYAIACAPSQERSTSGRLSALLSVLAPDYFHGIELPYLPAIGHEGAWPGYFFIKVTPHPTPLQLARCVDGVLEVSRFMHFSSEEVTIVQRASYLEETIISTLREGDEVCIINGPFTNFRAAFKRVISESKVQVYIKIFGRATEAVVDMLSIQPVKKDNE
jgi:transcription antitermination factor NusG